MRSTESFFAIFETYYLYYHFVVALKYHRILMHSPYEEVVHLKIIIHAHTLMFVFMNCGDCP